MSTTDFNRALVKINEAQSDTLELVRQWKSMVLGDATTEVTFTFFNGDQLTVPSILKLVADAGGNATIDPIALTDAKRDSNAFLRARGFDASADLSSGGGGGRSL